MNLDTIRESLISSANKLNQSTLLQDALNRKVITDDLLRHWSVAVPHIFRPTSALLGQVFNEETSYEQLIAPLEWFITGSDKPKDVLAKLKDVCPPPEMCGKVFKGGEPVYSCRDCGMDGTCVLCVDCFKNR